MRPSAYSSGRAAAVVTERVGEHWWPVIAPAAYTTSSLTNGCRNYCQPRGNEATEEQREGRAYSLVSKATRLVAVDQCRACLMDGETLIRVTEIEPSSNAFEDVKALSKRNQSLLGHLPWEVFENAARAGRLLGAWSEPELVGYCLYGFRQRDRAIILTHVCVASSCRGQGVARRLVEAALSANPLAAVAVATCRADYEAAKIWPALHFARVGTTVGKATVGSTLERWIRQLDDATLFARQDDERTVVAVDADVIRDIVEPRSEFEASVALADDWINDVADLVTVPHIETEINRAADDLPRLHGAVGRFRQLVPDSQRADGARTCLQSAGLPSAVGQGDRLNLAQAAAGGAKIFVTRDQALLGNAADILDLIGLDVLSPADVLLRLHADLNAGEYRPSSLVQTPIDLAASTAVPTTHVLSTLTNNEAAESARALRSVLESCVASTERGGRLFQATNQQGQTVAVLAERIDEAQRVLYVDALRVATDRDRYAIARQLVQLSRVHCIERAADTVMYTGQAPNYLAMALRDEGFAYASSGWAAACDRRHLLASDPSPDPASGSQVADLSPEAISRLESERWPLKLISGNVPTYVVPIRPAWAQALFDHDPPQGVLHLRDRRLGLSREHVYYRSKAGFIKAPARLLWYVSSNDPNAGIRAWSWLDAVTTDRARTLYQRFGGQGVYSRLDVERAAGKDGFATALTFSRTELFRHHLTLLQCRDLVPEFNVSGYLTTTREMPEHMFDRLYRKGMQQP